MLEATLQITTSTPIPAGITKPQILSFLHNDAKMLALNPLITECKPLDAAATLAFYKAVPTAHQPADVSTCKAFFVTEDRGGASSGSSSWTRKFVSSKVQYEMSHENTTSGLTSITHAPLNVNSVTTWVVREEEAGGLVVDVTGTVESNRVLMQFIKRMLPGDYREFAARFLEALKKDVVGGDVEMV